MTIDIATEQVVTLTHACKHLPQRRRGKRPALPTLYRWSNEGVNGVRLESIMVGGTRCTSVEALQRFFDALTAAADAEHSAAIVPPPLTKSRQQAIEAAERRLEVRAGDSLPATA
jgi:hypothetical protein